MTIPGAIPGGRGGKGSHVKQDMNHVYSNGDQTGHPSRVGHSKSLCVEVLGTTEFLNLAVGSYLSDSILFNCFISLRSISFVK